MRKVLVIMLLAMLNMSMAWGQNTIEKKLDEKYGFACEHEDAGKKWYSVRRNGLEGACDAKGKEIIPPAYDDVSVDYEDEFISATKDKKTSIFDLGGKLLLETPYEKVRWWQFKDEDYCEVVQNDLVGIINKKGELIIPCEFDKVDTYKILERGLSEVKQKEKMGVFSLRQRKLIIPCKYERLYTSTLIEKGYSVFINNTKYGVVDINGKEWIPGIYDYIEPVEGIDYFIAAQGGTRPDNASPLSNYNIMPQNAQWGVVDKEGKVIVPCEYNNIYKIIGDVAFIRNNVTQKYEEVGSYTDSKTKKKLYYYKLLFEGGLWGYINLKTSKKTDCLYKEYQYGEGYICCLNKSGKWGYLDAESMETVIPFEYDKVAPFKNGVAQVQKDGKATFLTDPKKGTSLALANGGGSIKVDGNIPQTNAKQEESFAFIIANENYTHLKGADYAINDGKVFKEYCQKTLGMPESNVRYFEDATYGNIVNAVKKIKDIADVYEGDAKIIVYFSGLGTTDAASKERYILPADASLGALNVTGYSVQTLMNELNALKTKQTIVILDAPFSGVDKEGKMLGDNRGVAIAPKPIAPQGNTVLVTACSGNESAYSLKDYGHSLFTYALLDKVQDSKGSCSLKEIVDYATTWVKRESLKHFNKSQTPITIISPSMTDKIQNIKF